jgi:putative aminopeptidase FrvX
MAADSPTLTQEVAGLLHVVSLTGYETFAAHAIRQQLGGLPVSEDALGNLTVTLGSGRPRRLVACSLDEAGYVVSHIRDDGYLQLSRVGRRPRSALWDQSHEGQSVVVVTAQGLVPGAVGTQSIHLAAEHAAADEPFRLEQAYVDVGAATGQEVQVLGIRLLDPVALWRQPVLLPGDLLAAPSAQTKAVCMAMVRAARQVARSMGPGTVVFAWTVLAGLGQRGLGHVVRQYGPFEEVFLLSDGFGWQSNAGQWIPMALPSLGSGPLAAGEVATVLPQTTVTPHTEPPAAPFTGALPWGAARIGYLGLPAHYRDTPVELIAMRDVAGLVETLVMAAGSRPTAPGPTAPLPESPPRLVGQSGDEGTVQVLGKLIAAYGVSGAEGPVREQIRALLPAWTQPRTDAKGNLLVTFGSGSEHVAFVAHLDEVGFHITAIQEDGRLVLRPKGGLSPSLWEAQAALVHTSGGAVPAIVEPRRDWHTATRRTPLEPLTAFVGATSRRAVEALAVQVGHTVTMPKRLLRLGTHRVLARSLDDRIGCTALLLALRHLQASTVPRRLTFAWVVEEEVGLVGSRALAATLPDVTRVYAVDTFVSSDAPLESPRFARAPLGQGAVLRAMDGGTVVPRRIIDEVLALAQSQSIPVQYGMTGGQNDGAAFAAYGVVHVPLAWPGRYSHSPVEVADLRDIDALVRLIVALALH